MQEFVTAHPFYTLIIVSVVVYGLRKTVSDFKNTTVGEERMSNDIQQQKKNVKLYSADGALLQEYNGVYIEYEDTNVYTLSHEYEGRCFLRIEKGANMLLMVEWYGEDKTKEDVKNV
ncbi:MAG: hypothetical protein QM497_06235 [Sulfurimonas sp.]